jgi:hypothetical protein
VRGQEGGGCFRGPAFFATFAASSRASSLALQRRRAFFVVGFFFFFFFFFFFMYDRVSTSERVSVVRRLNSLSPDRFVFRGF